MCQEKKMAIINKARWIGRIINQIFRKLFFNLAQTQVIKKTANRLWGTNKSIHTISDIQDFRFLLAITIAGSTMYKTPTKRQKSIQIVWFGIFFDESTKKTDKFLTCVRTPKVEIHISQRKNYYPLALRDWESNNNLRLVNYKEGIKTGKVQ